MRKILIILISLLCTSATVHAQGDNMGSPVLADTIAAAMAVVKPKTIDTLYYDKNWKVTDDKTFCSYYRVYALKDNNNQSRPYRDYYVTGELQAEGAYIYIDPYDDSKSIFDGECIIYSKAGKELEKKFFDNGKLQGEYCRYSDDGLLKVHCYYKDGDLDGIYTEFSDNGTECIQIEYQDGESIDDCCIISNADGRCSKVTISTREPIYESPSVDEKLVEYIKGTPWPYYNKNGILVSITNQSVSDYGKYYKIPILISNNTMFPFDIDPASITVTLTDKKGETHNLRVYSAEEYMKKVKRRQNTALFFTALSEGLAASNAGYSASATSSSTIATAKSGTTSETIHSHTTSTTTSYDGAAAYQAQLVASARVASYSDALLSEREAKDEGYLKKTTIYPGETISGYVHVERKKGETINVRVNINGAIFPFNWHVGK